MGKLDNLKSALKGTWDWIQGGIRWIQRVIKKASDSVEHVVAIEKDILWFYEKYEELEPEAQEKIDDMIYHIDELKAIWGYK